MRGIKADIPMADGAAPDDIPPAPEGLNAHARTEWERTLPTLMRERRTVTEMDIGIFANYCAAIGMAREAQAILAADGLIYQGESGPKKHPAVGILSDAMTQARQMAAELGLTPASRGRPAIKNGGVSDGYEGDLFGLGLN